MHPEGQKNSLKPWLLRESILYVIICKNKLVFQGFNRCNIVRVEAKEDKGQKEEREEEGAG